MYARVWEYEVRASDVEAFLATYGSSGAWVQLFARSEGYAGTRLFRDVDRADRFLTADRWTNYASWEAFLDRWGSDYREFDQRLRALADGGELIVEGFAEGV
jgi:heme-degrading monooxygenase HmoA